METGSLGARMRAPRRAETLAEEASARDAG
jgi:hypothetical protein